VHNPAAAASPIGASINSRVDRMRTLRTGLELTRASQLTMLRLQLALRDSNRRTAMQALDTLLDIDAEMEGLAATLEGAPAHMADDAALSGFIGLQKAAIAAEKHSLTGGDGRYDATSIAASAPGNWADGVDLPAQPLFSDDETEGGDRAGGGRWVYVVAAAIVIAAVGYGVIGYLWPALPFAIASLSDFG
jgi:hypothetical protein